MARKHLSYYLDNLSRLEEITVEELQDWQKEYPYVQNLKFLIAKKQQQISSNPDMDSLQLASTYSADRTFLYKQLANNTKLEKLPTKPKEGHKAPKVAIVTGGAAAIAAGTAASSKKKKKDNKATTKSNSKAESKEKSKDKNLRKSKAKNTAPKEAVKKAKAERKSRSKKSDTKTAVKTSARKSAAKKKASKLKYHDLKKVEGIGPKIEKLLYASNIRTYKQLAASSENRLRKALLKGGSRYKSHNPTTWPMQAELAAIDKWDQLKKLQVNIVGGKLKPAKKTSSKKSTKTIKARSASAKTKKPVISKVKKVTPSTKAKKKTAAPTKSAAKAKNTIKKKTAKKTKVSKPTPKKKAITKRKSASSNTTKKTTSKTKEKKVASSKAKKVTAKKTAAKKATKRSKSANTTARSKSKKSTTPKSKAKKKTANSKKVATTEKDKLAEKAASKKGSKNSKARTKKKDDAVSSFSQWLMSLRNEEKGTKKPKTKAKKPAKTNAKTDSKIKASVRTKDQVVSESLAKLLAKQGHHAKARSMYKKLSLLFPQKSAYFAAQIDKLKSNK